MNATSVLAVVCATVLAGCSSVEMAAHAGYMQMDVSGSVALLTGSGSSASSVEQGIGSGFGLGDQRGAPFASVDADLGTFTLSASGFWFEDKGDGVLAANFGGLAQATAVSSRLEIGGAKLEALWDIDLGPVTLSPGLAVDLFDFYFRASDSVGNAEIIDEILGVPMVVARGRARLGPFDARAEIGYIEGPSTNGSHSRFLDADAMLSWSVTKTFDVFAGYRLIDVVANGDTDTQSFNVDLQLRGWCIGGGIRF